MGTTRTGVRDGRPVLLKTCAGCGKEKVCDADPARSEFVLNGVRNGNQRWKPLCRECYAPTRRKANRSHAENEREKQRGRERYAAQKKDPAWRERRRQLDRASKQRRLEDPEKRERILAQAREGQRRRRRRRRKEVNEAQRMRYALRREREGKKVRRLRTVVDGTRPRIPMEPFRRWLVGWMAATGVEGSITAGRWLGIDPRRITGVMNRQTPQITVDIVDRAILRSRVVVEVDGVPIYRFDDLYPIEQQEAA